MKSEAPAFSFRLLPVALAVSALGIASLVGLRNYVNRDLGQPTPTLMASAIAIQSSPSATATSRATSTLVPPSTNTPRPEPSIRPSETPTIAPSPTLAESPTPSPTSKPQLVPSLAFTATVGFPVGTLPAAATAIPTPVPTFEVPLGTTNVLLLGSDIDLDKGAGRTDTMIIVAINRDGPTASMVSLPRDLYVYIPGWTMNRLNTALARGATAGYPGGAIAQLSDTILYNFGVPIHFYAQIDFEGFKQAVDLLGSVDIAVSCRLRDWRLKSPDLDPDEEESWEMFTLEPGVYEMDGDMALWYARSRRTTSDFDRGRRQQQLLRAMLDQGVDLGLLPQVPELWNTYQDSVKTNMDIGRMLQLATLAPSVRENGIQHLYIVGDQLQPWQVPGSGAYVQLPVWENMQQTFQRLFLPPALNRATRPPVTVEVINGTDKPDLATLTAENLSWYGFEPIISDQEGLETDTTTIQYYAQNFKGSFDWLLSWILDKHTSEIELVPDTPSDYDYRIVLGSDYSPCRPQLFAPQAFLEQ